MSQEGSCKTERRLDMKMSPIDVLHACMSNGRRKESRQTHLGKEILFYFSHYTLGKVRRDGLASQTGHATWYFPYGHYVSAGQGAVLETGTLPFRLPFFDLDLKRQDADEMGGEML